MAAYPMGPAVVDEPGAGPPSRQAGAGGDGGEEREVRHRRLLNLTGVRRAAVGRASMMIATTWITSMLTSIP